jgi:hypothetical protein
LMPFRLVPSGYTNQGKRTGTRPSTISLTVFLKTRPADHSAVIVPM